MENRKDIYVNPFFEPDPGYTSLRFHVLGVPQTPTHSDFSADAFALDTLSRLKGIETILSPLINMFDTLWIRFPV